MLKRLEAIKETIDPHYMFDCFKCIGNNRVKTSVDNGPSTEVSSSEPLGEAEAESTVTSTSEKESSGSDTSSVESVAFKMHSYWTLVLTLSVLIEFVKL
jgi:hypothetical protein